MKTTRFSVIDEMANSAIGNYGIPGVSSSLIGGNGHGMVRMFTSSRDHQEEIAPHSHKFNFACLVLKGTVRNRVWSQSAIGGDEFMVCDLIYKGKIGQYEKVAKDVGKFSYRDEVYKSGDWYTMDYQEIHSIHFSRGAQVLFFEGPVITNDTVILEPYVDGQHVKSFEVKPWMFTTAA